MSVDPLAASRIHRVRVGVGASIVLLLVALGIAVLVSAISSASASSTIVDAPGAGEPVAVADDIAPVVEAVPVFVHIIGEVNRPGLVQLREGDRTIDAVAAAGGFTEDADRGALNLARVVSDGEQIIVYAEGEAPTTPGGAIGTPGAGHGKININTADAMTLELLPRVGPALAARIIQWRDANGRFRSIEDLMSVSGIGEKTFAGLRDLVTV